MDFFIALIAVAAISLFFVVRFKLNASVAPFFVIAGITLFLCMLSMVGLVAVAGWLVYAFALLSLVYIFLIKKEPLRGIAKVFLTPGMAFFIVSSVFMFIALMQKNPYFIHWDEFSFWGTASKSIFMNRQIYTIQRSSMKNFSYPPALPLWSFFVQFFGSRFTEWKVYLAYDVMIMSVMSMLFARVKWKNVATAIVLTAFGLTSLYLFWHSFEGTDLYMTSYADLQIGVMFAGVLLGHFFSEENNLMRWVVSLVGVMFLPMIKDIGFALALVAAGIILVDIVISGSYPTQTFLKSKKKIALLILPLLLFAGIIVSYQLWALHFKLTTELSRAADPYQYSIFQMLGGQDAKFNIILQDMINALSIRQIVMFGPITDMIIVFMAIPIVVGIFTLDKKKIIRMSVFSMLMFGGFAAYYLFHAYSYAAIFKLNASNSLLSFPRYMSSYCAGWMIAAVAVCIFEISIPKIKKCNLVAGATVAALIVASVFYYAPVHPDQFILISRKVDRSYSPIMGLRNLLLNEARDFDGQFTEQDRFYVVCQQSDGGEQFMFNYDFMPAYTVDTLQGGSFVPKNTPDSEMGLYDARVGQKEFIAYLRAEQVNYVFVLKTDEYFLSEFASMFSDGISSYVDRSAYVYLVVDRGGDDYTLVPVPNGMMLQQIKLDNGVA